MRHSRGRADTLTAVATHLAGWSTPSARDWKDSEGMATEGTNPDGSTRNRTDQLPRQALLTGWASPSASDGTGAEAPEAKSDRGAGGQKLRDAPHLLNGWPTATAQDADSSGRMAYGTPSLKTMTDVASLSGWPTPMAGTPARGTNSAAGSTDSERRTEVLLGVEMAGEEISGLPTEPARLTSDGELLTGCSAGMDTGGQLDPAHSRWLMRLPDGWASCAPTETASTLRRRRLSAAPSARSSRKGRAEG